MAIQSPNRAQISRLKAASGSSSKCTGCVHPLIGGSLEWATRDEVLAVFALSRPQPRYTTTPIVEGVVVPGSLQVAPFLSGGPAEPKSRPRPEPDRTAWEQQERKRRRPCPAAGWGPAGPAEAAAETKHHESRSYKSARQHAKWRSASSFNHAANKQRSKQVLPCLILSAAQRATSTAIAARMHNGIGEANQRRNELRRKRRQWRDCTSEGWPNHGRPHN